jgi:hypothetical protein
MIGSTFHQSATSVGRTLALRKCASSPQTQYRMTFHQLLNHPLNPPAGRVCVQALPLPPNSFLFPSRGRSHFRVRAGAPGHNGSLRLRPPLFPCWHFHQHPLISLSQFRDRHHPRHYHRYHRVYSHASASTAALRNVRLMSHPGLLRYLRRVRALQSARGAGQHADSQPCRRMWTQIWMPT